MTISMLLLLGTAALWVHAQWVTDSFSYRWANASPAGPQMRTTDLYLHRSSLVISCDSIHFSTLDTETEQAFWRDLQRSPDWLTRHGPPAALADDYGMHCPTRGGFRAAGFAWQTASAKPDEPEGIRPTGFAAGYLYTEQAMYQLAIPWWFLSLLFALAPARAFYTWQKNRRRYPPHACQACGYDLRATSDATGPRLPACPECGRPASAP